MRILLTNTGSWGTGAGTVIDGVAHELIRLGHTVKVVFPDAGGHSEDRETYYGNPDLYEIIRFPIEYRGKTFDNFPLMIEDPNPRSTERPYTYRDMSDEDFRLFIELMTDRLGKVVADFVPDVIETHHIWIMGYILKRLGQKFIAVAHNSDQIGYRYDERMQPYAMSCANGADTIFAVSDFVRDEVLDLYQVPSEKVVTVENGFNETIFSPQTIDKKKLFDEYGISVDPNLPIVTFGGKLSRTKGVDTLIEANRLLQGEVPFHLVLFGVGDLEEVLGHPPTDDEMKHVTLMGHLPQSVLARFHNVARLSTVPSRFEGFNIAALEAMGCGLPVVGTRTGQIEKFVVGEIVEAADSEALAGAIKKILTMPDDEYVKLSKRATDVAANYSWPGNVQKRLLYYDGVSA